MRFTCISQVLKMRPKPLPRTIGNVEIPEAFRFQYAVNPQDHGGRTTLRLPSSGASFLHALRNDISFLCDIYGQYHFPFAPEGPDIRLEN